MFGDMFDHESIFVGIAAFGAAALIRLGFFNNKLKIDKQSDQILSKLPFPALIIQKNNNELLFYNQQALEIFGISQSETSKTILENIVSLSNKNIIDQIHQFDYKNNEYLKIASTITTCNQTQIPVNIITLSIVDCGVEKILILIDVCKTIFVGIEDQQCEQAIKYFIETEDFELYGQPIVDFNKNVSCYELLFRGNLTKYPELLHHTILEYADQTGLMISLGQAILKKGCYIGSLLNQKYNVCVSINVSAEQIIQCNFVEDVKHYLNMYNLSPSKLTLEVTESLIIESYHQHSTTLQQLRDIGVKIAIDDFGKGYSSLSHLRYLPADKIKIDKSFIDNFINDVKTQQVIKAIATMAHILEMDVVVEGVENDQQLAVLSELNVDLCQGYVIGHPQKINELLQ